MQHPIPPPGSALPFWDWARVLVDEIRGRVPHVTATRSGRRITLRHGNTRVTVDDERGTFVIRLHGDGTAMVTSLFDAHRHDAFTARNFAHTIAGHFDARCASGPSA